MKVKTKRKHSTCFYKFTHQFQIVWSVIWIWLEDVLARGGLLHEVRCIICSMVGKKKCLMMPKQSTLEKHDQCF